MRRSQPSTALGVGERGAFEAQEELEDSEASLETPGVAHWGTVTCTSTSGFEMNSLRL